MVSEKSLIEEREEVMVSEKVDTLKKTHFLNPPVTSIDSSKVAELPRRRRPSVSSSQLKGLLSRSSFSGFWYADSHFVSWLAKMETLHEPTWRKAGIFDAIKSSTYKITRNTSLILSIAEKWCPLTKSFVFPWGEATITLEDVMILLGFSVFGSPAFAPLETSDMRDAVEKLEKARQANASRDRRVCEKSWISSFLGTDHLEHEAFLALWLSLFVLPVTSRRSVSKHVFPIAVRLARGERIALAPTVLANVYRDLSRISGLTREKVNLKSLLKLVQVWTWERFKTTRPKPREIPKGEPRIAQWDCLQHIQANVRLSFDDFDWRPYTKPLKNWNPLRFYVEEPMWLTVDESLDDDEFVSFARCVRVSQLVGDGFVEDYYPHRVAMQFGLAQDLPRLVTRRRSFTEKEAWDDYCKALDGLKLYMPSRLARGSVTARYRDWWLKSVSEFTCSKEMENESTDDDDDDHNAPSKVLRLSQVFQKLEEEDYSLKCRRSRMQKKRGHEADDESFWDEEDDDMTIAKRTRYTKKSGKRRRKFQVVDDSDDDDSGPFASVKLEERSEEEDESASEAKKTRQLCDDEFGNAEEKKITVDEWRKKAERWLEEEGEKKRCNDKRKEDVFERLKQRKIAIKEKELMLEARIVKVEKTLAKIKTEVSA